MCECGVAYLKTDAPSGVVRTSPTRLSKHGWGIEETEYVMRESYSSRLLLLRGLRLGSLPCSAPFILTRLAYNREVVSIVCFLTDKIRCG